MSNALEIANTIKEQIGSKAIYMLAASNFVYSEKDTYLSFRIKGSRKANYIKITLTPMDVYTMEFGKIWGSKYRVVKTIEGVYCDQLNGIIEEQTGLYTSL